MEFLNLAREPKLTILEGKLFQIVGEISQRNVLPLLVPTYFCDPRSFVATATADPVMRWDEGSRSLSQLGEKKCSTS